MSADPLISSGFSLAAIVCWGTSDFSGGYASRRSDPFLVTLLAHAGGLALMTALALARHQPLPPRSSELWGLAAGALGGTALAIFYSALATGKMGITAPAAAIVGAVIPTLFGIMTQGLPGSLALIGFVLAGIGIWLLSRPDSTPGTRENLWPAMLAGLGFAGFFLCISQTGGSSALWLAAHARFASLVLVAGIVLARRGKGKLYPANALVGFFAGCLDSTGTFLFIRAEQLGRLDAAVVLTSLYPAITVLLARLILKERFTRWKTMGILAALAAVPLIAFQ